jgi:uncharacterized membrane protein YwaF
VLQIFIALKNPSPLLGLNCDPWVQHQAHQPLHHRGELVSMVTSLKVILQANNAFMFVLFYSKPHAFVSVVTPTMLTYCNPFLGKAEW